MFKFCLVARVSPFMKNISFEGNFARERERKLIDTVREQDRTGSGLCIYIEVNLADTLSTSGKPQ